MWLDAMRGMVEFTGTKGGFAVRGSTKQKLQGSKLSKIREFFMIKSTTMADT